MTAIPALTIDTPDLVVQASGEGMTLDLALVGTADSRAIGTLDALLEKVHQAALERAVEEVVVDLRGLTFMNSSCFKAFVKWLSTLQDLETARQYKICLRSSDEHHWQKRSLAALRCFAIDLVRIQSDG
jgi:hypothetical protein